MKPLQTYFYLPLLFLFLFTSAPYALAVSTASGTNIDNTATLGYEVAGINQADITSNTVSFVVDALVDLTVTGGGDQNGTPGQPVALEFTVSNDGNETYDFTLSSEFANNAGEFTATGLTLHVDTDGDGVNNDAASTTIDNLTADSSVKVWLVGTIPTSATDNQTATYHLMASARLADGNPIPAETTDTATTKQYVYGDASGPHSTDNANDTHHSASLQFIAQTAALSIVKSSAVIWDPINLASNPLHIPGAIIEYTLTINNGAGVETATAIAITDVLNSNLSPPTDPNRQYSAGSSIQVTAPNINGGATKNLTDASDADEGTINSQTVTVNGIELQAGESATVKILAEIQ